MRLSHETRGRLFFAALALLTVVGFAAWLRYAPEVVICAENGGAWNAATESCDY